LIFEGCRELGFGKGAGDVDYCSVGREWGKDGGGSGGVAGDDCDMKVVGGDGGEDIRA
jgi:hypothetical protein